MEPLPYIESYDGELRLLSISLPAPFKTSASPHVAIDGRDYLLDWGSFVFRVPSARPVHVAAWRTVGETTNAAYCIVPPGGDVSLEFKIRVTGAEMRVL